LLDVRLNQADVTYDLGLGTVEKVHRVIELDKLSIDFESYLDFFDALLPKNGNYVNETLESTAMWFCHWACGSTRYLWINEGFTETHLMPIMVHQYALKDEIQNNVTVLLSVRRYVAQISTVSFSIFVTFSVVTLTCSGVALVFGVINSIPSLKGFLDLEVAARMTQDRFDGMHQRFLRNESIEDIFADHRLSWTEVIRVADQENLEMVAAAG